MKVYEVEISGVKHTLQLSDEDAKKYPDAKAVGDSKATAKK